MTFGWLLKICLQKGRFLLRPNYLGNSFRRSLGDMRLFFGHLDSNVRRSVLGNSELKSKLSDIVCEGNTFIASGDNLVPDLFFWHADGRPGNAATRRVKRNSLAIHRIEIELRHSTSSYYLERDGPPGNIGYRLHVRGKRLSAPGPRTLAGLLLEVGLKWETFYSRDGFCSKMFMWAENGVPVVKSQEGE